MTPALLISKDDVLFVHQKSHWKEIQGLFLSFFPFFDFSDLFLSFGLIFSVGWTTTHVRFGLRKLPLTQKEDVDVEITAQAFIQFEIPCDHQVVDLFENDEFKGVRLKLIQLKSSTDKGFTMF